LANMAFPHSCPACSAALERPLDRPDTASRRTFAAPNTTSDPVNSRISTGLCAASIMPPT
jgi:hypothetical protein